MCVCCQVDSQQTLRDLRLQFAEQISLLAAEKKSSDIMETLFRGKKTNIDYWWKTESDSSNGLLNVFLLFVSVLLSDNRIESLIQKADQVLNSLSQSSGGADRPAAPAETRTQGLLANWYNTHSLLQITKNTFQITLKTKKSFFRCITETTWGSKETSLVAVHCLVVIDELFCCCCS